MWELITWTPGPPREAGPSRRALEVLVFVAIWIGIGELITGGTGWSLPGDAKYVSNTDISVYLLVGIPLVAFFQLWVRRQPIRDLWVRDGRPLGRRVAFRVLAVALAIYPLYSLIKVIADPPGGEAAAILFYGSIATIGAGAAAWAYLHFDRQTWRYLLLCILTAGAVGVIPDLFLEIHTLAHPTTTRPDQDFWWGVLSFLQFVPTVMVMEEVAFRGAFDSHAHHEGDRRAILTAIYVSCLWGIWHAPLVGWENFASLILYQGAVGTFLSIWWRKSGNLEVSGTTHALIDAIRNATGGTP
jgi:membrane protease YdiL (CAAX protease family)